MTDIIMEVKVNTRIKSVLLMKMVIKMRPKMTYQKLIKKMKRNHHKDSLVKRSITKRMINTRICAKKSKTWRN